MDTALIKNLILPLALLSKNGQLILTNLTPWKDFNTGEILGTKATVVCVANTYSKLTVKLTSIPKVTQEQIDESAQPMLVDFHNFEAKLYQSQNNGLGISATADSLIILKDEPAPPQPTATKPPAPKAKP